MYQSSKVSPDVLWIDLRSGKNKKQLLTPESCNAAVFDGALELELFRVLGHGLYKAIVFHYDAPTSTGLRLLEKVKQSDSVIPVIMVTEAHSEALAVWALRTRVWDYFVEPTDSVELVNAINTIVNGDDADAMQQAVRHGPVTRLSACSSHSARGGRRDIVALAKAFIEENFHEDISQKDVAAHLNVSYAHLSRLFKQQCGCNFNQFLWNARIAAAKTLMLDGDVSVTAICYEVGCSDPGYFATKFRAETNMTPTEYRQQMARSQLADLAIAV
jgi:YesN/AraC family two-component response regulator